MVATLGVHTYIHTNTHILDFTWVTNSVSTNKLVSNLAHNKNDLEKKYKFEKLFIKKKRIEYQPYVHFFGIDQYAHQGWT